MTNNEIAIMILDLLAAESDDQLDDACAALCDAFCTTAMIDIHTARATMRAAHISDPTESYHAAHLRDTIRDNFDIDPD